MTIEKLKKSLKEEKVIYGLRNTLINLKNGKTDKVFLAGNCPKEFKDEIKKFNVDIIELKEPNKELALICKKKFSVNLLSSVKK